MTHQTATPLRDPEAPEPASRATFSWSDARLLGFQSMDESHADFYRVVQAMLICDERSMTSALSAFEEHAIEHFGQEEAWMRTTEFPPTDCHVKEHESILRSIEKVKASLASGEAGFELVQEFALFLFEWFPGHSDYLDSALAAWMCKRTYGGKPIVFRRKLD